VDPVEPAATTQADGTDGTLPQPAPRSGRHYDYFVDMRAALARLRAEDDGLDGGKLKE
jgi:hypothetical protein